MLRTRLARPGRTLRLLDTAPLDPVPVDSVPVDRAPADTPPPDAAPDEERVTASVTDLDAMTAACAGVDAVIHLAAIADEAAWERIAAVNIEGSYVAFEAARRAGGRRGIFSSPQPTGGVAPPSAFPAPDSALPAPHTHHRAGQGTRAAPGARYPHPYGMGARCTRVPS